MQTISKQFEANSHNSKTNNKKSTTPINTNNKIKN